MYSIIQSTFSNVSALVVSQDRIKHAQRGMIHTHATDVRLGGLCNAVVALQDVRDEADALWSLRNAEDWLRRLRNAEDALRRVRDAEDVFRAPESALQWNISCCAQRDAHESLGGARRV